ncbi:protein Hook homolog 1 isoform X3 [Ictalurus furcatus]|uniref:protein Hook homolog 1 isoform X3 n=1 Tax=Ictalurus furcatus TaxID=66913 RepID=UPI002350AA5F|nr:protein Hook homolog 1 isoform X3 [Ictalurus furcatus]
MDARSLPLLNKNDQRFHLEVENRLKNIFVTQLEDHGLPHSREEGKNVKHIPVITESSDRILKTGINTLQKTLVLKTQVQLDDVNRQLLQKRLEFKDRMQALEQRRAALLEKQEETKERAMKFEKFVEENEVKRRRALKKYQLEKKENELREEEKSKLYEELEQLQLRHQQLKERVDKYKIYEEYMMKILDLLPEDSLVMPIIRRHETLSITQQDLLQRLTSLAEELDQGRCNLDSLKLEHSTSRLMSNKELSELRTQWDQIREKNKQLEMTLYIQHDQSVDQIEEIGCLLLAVKNLAQQCHLQHYGPLQKMDSLTMMDMIKEFILETVDTERRALQITDSSSEPMKRSRHRGSKGPALTMDESTLVSIKEATSAQTLEESKAEKYQDICHQFGFIRRVKGDGNCFYRALCFTLVESLLHNESAIQRFRDMLVRSHQVLLAAGFDESTFKDLFNTFNRVLERIETDAREETLLNLFNDQATSDSMVQYLRLLTSAHLQSHADFFQHFVEAPNLKAYCTQEVEAMAMECDHVEILALSEELDISLCIISMDGSDGHLTYHTIPEGSQPSLYLLYKTSHYDILYKHRGHWK